MIAVQAENIHHYLEFVKGFMDANPLTKRKEFIFLDTCGKLPDHRIHIVYRLPGWEKNKEAELIQTRIERGRIETVDFHEYTDTETLRRFKNYCEENLRFGKARGYIARYYIKMPGERP